MEGLKRFDRQSNEAKKRILVKVFEESIYAKNSSDLFNGKLFLDQDMYLSGTYICLNIFNLLSER